MCSKVIMIVLICCYGIHVIIVLMQSFVQIIMRPMALSHDDMTMCARWRYNMTQKMSVLTNIVAVLYIVSVDVISSYLDIGMNE